MSFRLIRIFCSLLIALSILSSCATSSSISPHLKGQKPPAPPEGYKPEPGDMLPLSGENCCATFRSDSGLLLFLSRKRVQHDAFQVYSYDVVKRKEKRITHHDGDDQGVSFSADGQFIVYASSTDEEKEFPSFFRQALGDRLGPDPQQPEIQIGPRPLWTQQPFEIYRSRLDGRNIERLTVRPGFDAEVHSHPSTNQLVFTSTRNGIPQIYRLDSDLKVIRLSYGKLASGEPKWSPRGDALAWVEFAEDFQTSQIVVADSKGRKPKAVTTGPGLKLSPQWHPNGTQIFFSSNLDDPENYEIYLVGKDGSCQARVTYQLGHDLLPAIHPDGKSLIVTSNRSGDHQLYLTPFHQPPCP